MIGSKLGFRNHRAPIAGIRISTSLYVVSQFQPAYTAALSLLSLAYLKIQRPRSVFCALHSRRVEPRSIALRDQDDDAVARCRSCLTRLLASCFLRVGFHFFG